MRAEPPNETLKELAEILGDGDTRELVRSFLSDFPGTLRHLASGTREERQRIVHGLKSSARHMGADALARRMAALEARLGGDPEANVTQEDLAGTVEDFEKAAAGLRAFAQPPR